jgi:lantibiotic biosynthesis protein
MKKKVEEKIEEIFNTLCVNHSQHNSLINGGELLFLYQYAKHTKSEKSLNHFKNELEQFISNFQQTDFLSFSSGLFGNVWLLAYFTKENVIDDLLKNISNELNEILETTCTQYINEKNYDFLHGLLGLMYLSSFCDVLDKNIVSNTLKAMLSDKKMDNTAAYYTISENEKKSNEEIAHVNLGLAHGLPSITSVFAKLKNIDPTITDTVIQLCNYIFKNKSQKKYSYQNLFPSVVAHGINEVDCHHTRLAWCYGDLGIACSFWNVGTALNIEQYKQEAVEILLHNTHRKNLETNNVIDAGICHGAAGIAHIFNRFYKETKLKGFDEARLFWLNETLKMATFNDGLAGYKKYYKDTGWVNDYGLLEGIAGIGLVLLGFLTDDINDLNWDQCLLIS